MLFNPLFVQLGTTPDLVDSPKSTKLNNTSYLFSDIIRVVNDESAAGNVKLPGNAGQSNSKGSSGLENLLNLFNIKTLSSQVADDGSVNSDPAASMQQLLKELFAGTSSNTSDILTALTNNSAVKNGGTLNLLASKADLDSFLQKLLDAMPALKMVSDGDKNFLVKAAGTSGSKDGSNDKQQVEDAILNMLQANNSVILNFNFNNQNFKIELTKVDGVNTDDNNSIPQIDISGLSAQNETGQASDATIVDGNSTANNNAAESNGAMAIPDAHVNAVDKSELIAEAKKLTGSLADNAAAITADGGTSETTQNTKSNLATDQNQNAASALSAGNIKNQAGENAKYILTVKANSAPQSAENTTQLKDAVLKNANENTATANNTVELDFSNLSEQKTADSTGVKANAGSKELFNPPLTLKLSMKQQLKSIDVNSADNLPAGDLQKNVDIKLSKNELQNAVDPGSIKNSSGAANSSTAQQSAFPNQASVSEVLSESVGQSLKVTLDSQTDNTQQDPSVKPVDIAAPAIKSDTTNLKAQDEASSLTGKGNGQAIQNESGNPVLQTDNNGEDGNKKFSDDKQKNPDLKNAAAQAMADFDKTIAPKEKIADGGSQFTASLKTINVSDINKEFASIISQKESKSVVLQLKPENLGKIKLSVDVVNNVVHAHVEVENDSIKQIVQSNIDTLRHSLNLNGLQLSTVDVSLSGGQQKSFKSFSSKKKYQYTGNNVQINDEPESLATKKMGYNTYEYLI